MNVEAIPGVITPARAKELLRHWFQQKRASFIDFRENDSPLSDPDASYAVVYAAQFRPSVLDQAQAEVWITNDGQVAIGFERTERIAERLGVESKRPHFAAGHEPLRMSESGMLTILDLIADGDLGISAQVMPLLGLIGTAAVFNGDVQALLGRAYLRTEWAEWIKTPESATLLPHRLLRYQAWS